MKTGKTSSYLSFLNLKKGEFIMFFRCILLGMLFVLLLFLFDIYLMKIKSKYQLYKNIRERKINQKKFRNKMKELEIK